MKRVLKSTLKKLKKFLKENENKIVLAAGGFLIALIAFGLGFLWREEITKKPLEIKEADLPAFFSEVRPPRGSTSPRSDLSTLKNTNNSSALADTIRKRSDLEKFSEFYVASKKGKAYHLPDCPGAQRIKPENLIKFQTKEEAEKAGYNAAKNCKGL